MINENFFKRKKPFFTILEVLEITNSKLEDGQNHDLNQKIHNIATLDDAGENDISLFHSAAYKQNFLNSKAGFCFVDEKSTADAPNSMISIVNENPYFAYGKFLQAFFNDTNAQILAEEEKISLQATISKTAEIGENVVIKAGVVIGDNVKIAKNSFIGANSVISDNCSIGENVVINSLVAISHCVIGNNVIIHNGAKIGQDGFGFAHHQGKLQKILQLGIVEIHDGAEIGSSSCIDRGAINNTVIGKQVKIDNMVQIGHNVQIGEGSVLAGCSAVAGSAKIGRFVQIGGGSNISGHLEIGDGAKVAGMSGVVKSIAPMHSVGGLPAVPIKDWHRMSIKMMQMIRRPKK
ncbi:MAG: UDP-3-O-[3-hydroxymyristoyl] glucosamine N-acyltransferase [Lentimonas sp.]|jgi:UDP-3-O-[3-hydroxymyristoyl] glucosamine N-acyltransferase